MAEGLGLLNLPAELRLEIYEAIVDSDIDTEAIRQRPGHLSRIYLAPWVNMLLVCRQIKHELQEHMKQSLSGKRSKHNTWILHLPADFCSMFPQHVKLPCPPSQLRAVQVILPPVRSIYRTNRTPYTLDNLLSLLVRRGPSFRRDKLLPSPLRFEELIMVFPAAAKLGIPVRYHVEEGVVLKFRQLQWAMSVADHPLAGAFGTVTLVTEEYEQSWTMAREED